MARIRFVVPFLPFTHEATTMKHTLLIMATLATLSAPALADEALARSKNCMACHAVDRKLVGPSYKDIAKRYAADAKAVEVLAGKIQKGGSGVWGPIPCRPIRRSTTPMPGSWPSGSWA